MMSVVWAKSTSGLRSTSAFSGTAARSSARTSFSEPLPARPIGVRMASTMTASGISAPRLTDQSIVPRTSPDTPHRARGEGAARGQRLLRGRAVRPRGEQAGGERIARAGGIHDVHGLGGRTCDARAVGPQRAPAAEGDDDL